MTVIEMRTMEVLCSALPRIAKALEELVQVAKQKNGQPQETSDRKEVRK